MPFAARLALKEKQIQQSYRPIIGVHKWFARRPGTLFRNLLLAEFSGPEPPALAYWHAHERAGVIADPFMGGGTPLIEAARLGFSVVGTDVNPMAYWTVRQSLGPLDLHAFEHVAAEAVALVEAEVGDLYTTRCALCGDQAPVKYFLWVKVGECPRCAARTRLFPGYLLAEAVRHPRNVVACAACGALSEYDQPPTRSSPAPCSSCGASVSVEGPARRNVVACQACGHSYRYPPRKPNGPPAHEMWAIEYHCPACRRPHRGRLFKAPDAEDAARLRTAATLLRERGSGLPLPTDEIPPGDETDRLHRWGYRHYREMFNGRQLLGLGLLMRTVMAVPQAEERQALLTVFSDFLRYQNMLCRYDTYALKCQDIFSVHGFPVGLVQCENSLLGVPGVGSGSFRHFVEKYSRAKAYCQQPFETDVAGRSKRIVPIRGESIQPRLVSRFPRASGREAFLSAASAEQVLLPPGSLDGVFTDPPYYANVQYAELMDFCFVWLRLALRDEFPPFRRASTRSPDELTGNLTMGRGLTHFTEGLSVIFGHYAAALKPGAPFVFTYHHNDPAAYMPLVVAVLDAGLDCTAALPAPAEMGASLHIARSGSSVLDTVFVCRQESGGAGERDLRRLIGEDLSALSAGGVQPTEGDVRCLLSGRVAKLAINDLRGEWRPTAGLEVRMSLAAGHLKRLRDRAPAAASLCRTLRAPARTA